MEKPFIICHMIASIDGRIDCAMTEKIDTTNSYYDALAALNAPSILCGKTTMAMHNAAPGRFVPSGNDAKPLAREAFHKAVAADAYTLSVDTVGELLWDSNVVENLPLVCVVSERVSRGYLRYLEDKKISWIATGRERIDLARAMEIARKEFGIARLALVGGGHINGAFLAAGLIDEVSVMFGAAIDGRKGFAAVFDGIDPAAEPFPLKLKSVEQFDNGTVWLRYTTK